MHRWKRCISFAGCCYHPVIRGSVHWTHIRGCGWRDDRPLYPLSSSLPETGKCVENLKCASAGGTSATPREIEQTGGGNAAAPSPPAAKAISAKMLTRVFFFWIHTQRAPCLVNFRLNQPVIFSSPIQLDPLLPIHFLCPLQKHCGAT